MIKTTYENNQKVEMHTDNYKITCADGKKYKIGKGWNYVYDSEKNIIHRWLDKRCDAEKVTTASSNDGPDTIDLSINESTNSRDIFNYELPVKHNTCMSFYKFKNIIKKLPPSVARVNLYACSLEDVSELEKYFEFLEYNYITPNITIYDDCNINKEMSLILAKYCSEVNINFTSSCKLIKLLNKLSEGGPMPILTLNILFSSSTYNLVKTIINNIMMDVDYSLLDKVRLVGLKKPETGVEKIRDLKKYSEVIKFAYVSGLNLTFDKCMACNYVCAIKDFKNRDELLEKVEPCDSAINSYYIDSKGLGYPCRYCTSSKGINGTNILGEKSFNSRAWSNYHSLVMRNKLLYGKRKCPLYNLQIEDLP